LEVLFVGINPDPASADCGHHFANPRNSFWKLLRESGFTERQYAPFEEAQLISAGIGITNLIPRVSRSSSELTASDFERGRRALRRKVARWRPRAIVFVGVTAWRAMQKRPGRPAPAGPREIHGASVWVLPNPSGRNAAYTYCEMLRKWQTTARDLRWHPK
jgi:TDG/mug DNA glycosylase family protein